MFVESVVLSNHLILCHSLLLLPSIFPSIRVFSNELALHIRWPKYWSLSISTSNEYSGLASFRIGWFDLLARDSLESSPAPQFESINSSSLSLLYGPILTSVRVLVALYPCMAWLIASLSYTSPFPTRLWFTTGLDIIEFFKMWQALSAPKRTCLPHIELKTPVWGQS